MVTNKHKRQADMDQILEDLIENDVIEVHFIDASKVENVRTLDNKVFATYKKVIGRFWCIKLDALYEEEFLILWTMLTDNARREIISVPMASIQKIEILNKSRTILKQMSDIGMPILTGADAKPVTKEEGIGEEINE